MSYAYAWFDPERGRMIVDEMIAIWNELGNILHVPSVGDVFDAGEIALRDGLQAAQSSFLLLFLLGQPVLRSLGWIAYWVTLFIWKFIIVEGIYHHGLSTFKDWLVRYWAWQTSLTQKQILLELFLVSALFGLYRFHLLLKRRKYLERLFLWFGRNPKRYVLWGSAKKSAYVFWNGWRSQIMLPRDVQFKTIPSYSTTQTWLDSCSFHFIQQIYYSGVRRIARYSLFLAAMTSHIAFALCAAAVSLSLPTLVDIFAKPNFIGVLSFWVPLFCTITSLFEEERKYLDKQIASKDEVRFVEPNRHSNDERVERSKKQQRRQALTSERCLKDDLDGWLRFWIVRGSLEAMKSLLAWFTPSSLAPTLQQLEFFFYVWIYCLPLIQPQSISGQALPEGRPLRVICSVLVPFVQRCVEAVSGAVPMQFWDTHIVGYARQLLSALVLVRIFKQRTSEWLLHVLEEGRGLVIPAVSLMTPGFLTGYGVVYVQYFVSIAKSSSGETVLWLRYWVLHALIDAALYHFSSILWWIPFSTHAIFCLWCYLSLPKTILCWYDMVEHEFKQFGLLPGEHEGTFNETKTAKVLCWIWEMLPKAVDSIESEIAPLGTTAAGSVVVSDHSLHSEAVASAKTEPSHEKRAVGKKQERGESAIDDDCSSPQSEPIYERSRKTSLAGSVVVSDHSLHYETIASAKTELSHEKRAVGKKRERSESATHDNCSPPQSESIYERSRKTSPAGSAVVSNHSLHYETIASAKTELSPEKEGVVGKKRERSESATHEDCSSPQSESIDERSRKTSPFKEIMPADTITTMDEDDEDGGGSESDEHSSPCTKRSEQCSVGFEFVALQPDPPMTRSRRRAMSDRDKR